MEFDYVVNLTTAIVGGCVPTVPLRRDSIILFNVVQVSLLNASCR